MTVNVVFPEMLVDGSVAVIDVVPVANNVAKPFEPAALLMFAKEVVDELQTTDVVRSRVVLSAKVPVAVNCWLVPQLMLGLVGVTAIETSGAAVTVNVVLPEIPSALAVIVVEPGVRDVAKPMVPEALSMVATDVVDELQLTTLVTSFVVPSE